MGKGRDKRRRTKHKDEVRIYKSEPPGSGSLPLDPYAPVHAPLKPKPSSRSGAIALAEPKELEFSEAIGVRISK